MASKSFAASMTASLTVAELTPVSVVCPSASKAAANRPLATPFVSRRCSGQE